MAETKKYDQKYIEYILSLLKNDIIGKCIYLDKVCENGIQPIGWKKIIDIKFSRNEKESDECKVDYITYLEYSDADCIIATLDPTSLNPEFLNGGSRNGIIYKSDFEFVTKFNNENDSYFIVGVVPITDSFYRFEEIVDYYNKKGKLNV